MEANAKITVHGLVQGVGFRWFVHRRASELGLKGFVENTIDGSVYLEVEGERGLIEELLKYLKIGPRSAHVSDIDVEWDAPKFLFLSFRIKG